MARMSSNRATVFRFMILAILIGSVVSGAIPPMRPHSASAQSLPAPSEDGRSPAAAEPYRRSLIREVRLIWGLQSTAAVMAAQIQQESAWLPTAHSKYASGLAQFTPQTASWISGSYPKELGTNQPTNPEWAIRALVRYDYDLMQPLMWAKTDCDRWAFTLSAYNGGPGWIERDRRLCAAVGGCDPDKWFEHVERYTSRSAAAAKENRGYPHRILLVLQTNYRTWGEPVKCSV